MSVVAKRASARCVTRLNAVDRPRPPACSSAPCPTFAACAPTRLVFGCECVWPCFSTAARARALPASTPIDGAHDARTLRAMAWEMRARASVTRWLVRLQRRRASSFGAHITAAHRSASPKRPKDRPRDASVSPICIDARCGPLSAASEHADGGGRVLELLVLDTNAAIVVGPLGSRLRRIGGAVEPDGPGNCAEFRLTLLVVGRAVVNASAVKTTCPSGPPRSQKCRRSHSSSCASTPPSSLPRARTSREHGVGQRRGRPARQQERLQGRRHGDALEPVARPQIPGSSRWTGVAAPTPCRRRRTTARPRGAARAGGADGRAVVEEDETKKEGAQGGGLLLQHRHSQPRRSTSASPRRTRRSGSRCSPSTSRAR